MIGHDNRGQHQKASGAPCFVYSVTRDCLYSVGPEYWKPIPCHRGQIIGWIIWGNSEHARDVSRKQSTLASPQRRSRPERERVGPLTVSHRLTALQAAEPPEQR